MAHPLDCQFEHAVLLPSSRKLRAGLPLASWPVFVLVWPALARLVLADIITALRLIHVLSGLGTTGYYLRSRNSLG